MTVLRDSGELILWGIVAVVGLGALMALPALIDDGWHALLRARSRHPRTPSAQPPPSASPTESETRMTDFRPDRNDPVTPAGGDPQAPTAEAAKLEQRAVEAEAAAAKAAREAIFAGHDHAAMELRIGAMERELERLGLARGLAARAAETADDHLRAAEEVFLEGRREYEVEMPCESLHIHRRWRLMEQAKASATSRNLEAKALAKAVRDMTLEIERVKETGPYREAMAKRTGKAAEAARQRADEARAAADAAAAKAGIRKPTTAPDDHQA